MRKLILFISILSFSLMACEKESIDDSPNQLNSSSQEDSIEKTGCGSIEGSVHQNALVLFESGNYACPFNATTGGRLNELWQACYPSGTPVCWAGSTLTIVDVGCTSFHISDFLGYGQWKGWPYLTLAQQNAIVAGVYDEAVANFPGCESGNGGLYSLTFYRVGTASPPNLYYKALYMCCIPD